MRTLEKSLRYTTASLILLSAFSAHASAQALRLPRPSQKASVMQTVGVTDVTIVYSRPGVKGRKIWGDPPAGVPAGSATLDDARARSKDAPIVPFGRVWRTGANEATLFEVTDGVLINGQPLAAGRYSLHTIPAKDGDWTIIFNSDAGQWGSFSYDEKKDVLRVKAKPEMVADNQEWLEYSIEPVAENSAKVNIRWEKVSVPFTVEVKDVKALAIEKARSAISSAKPDDWQIRVQAANFALQNKLNTEEAMQWLDQSIKIRENFNNVGLKARTLAEQGKTAEAIAAGEKAIQLGKAANANAQAVADMEKRVAEWKSKM
jgi:hypothetical protein